MSKRNDDLAGLWTRDEAGDTLADALGRRVDGLTASQRELAWHAKHGDPIAAHILWTRYGIRVWTEDEIAAEDRRRKGLPPRRRER